MRKDNKISYIFEETSNNVPIYGFDLISMFNISENIMLRYFRLQSDSIDLSYLDSLEYKTYYERTRSDVIHIYFNTLNNYEDLLKFLEANIFEYPTELDFISLGSKYEEGILNLRRMSLSDYIKKRIINLSISIYENVIILEFGHNFYDSNRKKVEKILNQWESKYRDVNYRKSVNFKM